MSRLGRLGLLTALALLVGPGSAPAQQTEEGLVQHLDSLRPLLDDARRELAAYERAAERALIEAAAAAARIDTLRVGLVTVIAPSAQSETARALFSEVWDEHYADISESEGIAAHTFVFQWHSELVPIHADGLTQRIEHRRFVPRSRMLERIRGAIATALRRDLARGPDSVGSWASSDPFSDHDPAVLYRQLVTARSVSALACLEGSAEACAHSLGLGLGPDPLAAWYTPEQRIARVAEDANLATSRWSAERWEACVTRSVVTACDALIRELRPGPRWLPLPLEARGSFLALALERGGPGAWARLLAVPDASPEEALEAAAGVPVEALAAEWRAWVVAGRPDVHAGLVPNSGLTLMWTLVFAAFAMRSTRWRLG